MLSSFQEVDSLRVMAKARDDGLQVNSTKATPSLINKRKNVNTGEGKNLQQPWKKRGGENTLYSSPRHVFYDAGPERLE